MVKVGRFILVVVAVVQLIAFAAGVLPLAWTKLSASFATDIWYRWVWGVSLVVSGTSGWASCLINTLFAGTACGMLKTLVKSGRVCVKETGQDWVNSVPGSVLICGSTVKVFEGLYRPVRR